MLGRKPGAVVIDPCRYILRLRRSSARSPIIGSDPSGIIYQLPRKQDAGFANPSIHRI